MYASIVVQVIVVGVCRICRHSVIVLVLLLLFFAGVALRVLLMMTVVSVLT